MRPQYLRRRSGVLSYQYLYTLSISIFMCLLLSMETTLVPHYTAHSPYLSHLPDYALPSHPFRISSLSLVFEWCPLVNLTFCTLTSSTFITDDTAWSYSLTPYLSSCIHWCSFITHSYNILILRLAYTPACCV